MIVVDASVIVPALANDEDEGVRRRARLSGERLNAPEVVGVEVVSALRKLVAARELDVRRAEAALSDFVEMRLALTPHRPLLPRCWELRHNLTPYDAAYIALAELRELTLVTADRRLASTPGIRCDVEVLA